MNSYQKRKQELAYYKQRCKLLEEALEAHMDEGRTTYLCPEDQVEAQEEINRRRSATLVKLISQ